MLINVLAFFAAFLIGISKAGLKGIGVFMVTLMAMAYGAKASTGIVLPLLFFGDVMAVIYYKKNCRWKYLIKFLPAMIIGILIAVWFGKDLQEEVFKNWMAIIILISVLIMWWRDRFTDQQFPNSWVFAGTMGITAGFTTMIGNLAGAFSNIFFLATRLPKVEFIGTAAYLYLISNMIKLPFHAFVWKTITIESLKIDALLAIMVGLGFWIGLKIVGLFNEKAFRKFILIMTAIGAILIFIR